MMKIQTTQTMKVRLISIMKPIIMALMAWLVNMAFVMFIIFNIEDKFIHKDDDTEVSEDLEESEDSDNTDNESEAD